MAKTSADFMVERLMDWGVRRIFGFPGDGINGLMGALERNQEKIRFIQARHEEMAAFMACAHAKFTGEAGVCMATSGPGAIHLLNGLYDAKMDHMPVVAIVGQAPTTVLGSDYQQEVDLPSLFKDVAHEYVHQVSNPMQVRTAIDRALRIALDRRTVTCVIVPHDIQEMDAVETPPHKHGTVMSGIGYNPPVIVPQEGDLRRAADILNQADKVAMLVGAGAMGASQEVQQVAELLDAGVAKALLGKAVLPDDLPYVTGCIGLLGTRPSWNIMMDCDAFFMIGSAFPYTEFLPKEGQARGVQIDIDARNLSIRYPMEVNLQGDARATLQALLPLLKRKRNPDWLDKIKSDVEDWWKLIEERAMVSAEPINPQRLFWELSSRLPDNSILTCDSGSSADWYARDLKFRRGMMGSLSGGLATMCPGVPYAIAAKFAYPDRPVIAMVGDGAMQMLGMNGLITISKYWHEWQDPRLIVLVLDNHDLNLVTWEQRILAGDPKFVASQELPTVAFADYAQSLGLRGYYLDDPERIASVWDDALSADRPVLIDAITDRNVPPLPPHISFEQANHFMGSMLRGDVDAAKVIKQSFKQMLQGVFAKEP